MIPVGEEPVPVFTDRLPMTRLNCRAFAVALSASVSLWRSSFSDHGGMQRVALYQHNASHTFSLSSSIRYREQAVAKAASCPPSPETAGRAFCSIQAVSAGERLNTAHFLGSIDGFGLPSRSPPRGWAQQNDWELAEFPERPGTTGNDRTTTGPKHRWKSYVAPGSRTPLLRLAWQPEWFRGARCYNPTPDEGYSGWLDRRRASEEFPHEECHPRWLRERRGRTHRSGRRTPLLHPERSPSGP